MIIIKVVVSVSLLFCFPGFLSGEAAIPGDSSSNRGPDLYEKYPIMRFDRETFKEWMADFNSAPGAYIDPALHPKRGSWSLLDHLQYTPSERNQGNCPNCWAWAGTGSLGIALSVQKGIKDRLSVQYLNSCMSDAIGKPCCTTGSLENFADFYSTAGYRQAVPWSNPNAEWQDGDESCDTACGSISTEPHYSIFSISDASITTHEVGQATAIDNIKNVLNQKKAVYFIFFFGNYSDWGNFAGFWNTQSEDDIFNSDFSCGHDYIEGEGAGHAVLCVGYNDDDPDNSYWILLNSWGPEPGRPNVLFRWDMDINYDCNCCLQSDCHPSLYWRTLNVAFEMSPPIEERLCIDSGDYDGDGESDIAIFRPETDLWAVRGLGRIYFGTAGDIPVSGDYNGDGYTDPAIFRPTSGLWAIKEITRFYYGGGNDLPAPADYDGDGSCGAAVFGKTTGRWGVRGITNIYFGAPDDFPVPGDFDGDGSSDIAVFRPSTGLWAVRGYTRFYFGARGDIPVPGVYRWYGSLLSAGPFRNQIAVFRPTTGLWAIRGITRLYFGRSGDTPVVGNFRLDSLDNLAIFRPLTGLWAIRGDTRIYYGMTGDIPATR